MINYFPYDIYNKFDQHYAGLGIQQPYEVLQMSNMVIRSLCRGTYVWTYVRAQNELLKEINMG